MLISGCSTAELSSNKEDTATTTIRVSAASSLQDVMNETKKVFENQHSNITVVFNFGSSGSLKQQISMDAPIDLYLSASTQTVNALVEEGKLKENNIANVLQNELVLIEPAHSDSKIEQLQDITKDNIEKIAIGTPDSVPAGKYAEESLENIDGFDKKNLTLVQAKNVRQVLTYVENEDVAAGFVYKTDALISDKINTVISIDNDYHSPINYPAAITNQGKDKQEAQALFQFFQSDSFKKIAEDYGFKAQVEQ